MSETTNIIVKEVTDWALKSSGTGLARKFTGSAISLALMSATPALPEAWEAWFQFPLFGLFAACVLGIVKTCLFDSS